MEEKKNVKEWLIFIFGEDRKTRFFRILLTIAIFLFFIIIMFGINADLGVVKIKPVADIEIKINK